MSFSTSGCSPLSFTQICTPHPVPSDTLCSSLLSGCDFILLKIHWDLIFRLLPPPVQVNSEALWKTRSAFRFCKWERIFLICPSPIYFTSHNAFQLHPSSCLMSVALHDWIKSHCVYTHTTSVVKEHLRSFHSWAAVNSTTINISVQVPFINNGDFDYIPDW